jgi:hypothetical protein
LPYAAAQVARSTTSGGSAPHGNAIAIGLVPSMRSAPNSGATSLVEFVIAQPMCARSRPCIAYQPAIP